MCQKRTAPERAWRVGLRGVAGAATLAPLRTRDYTSAVPPHPERGGKCAPIGQ